MINVDDLMNIVVLQDDRLLQDFRRLASGIERHERRSEKLLRLLVAVAQRMPVVPQVDRIRARVQHFDIGDEMRRARLGGAGR